MEIFRLLWLGGFIACTMHFPVNLRALQDKFCGSIYPYVVHGADSIEHIFGELYAVPEKIKLL